MQTMHADVVCQRQRRKSFRNLCGMHWMGDKLPQHKASILALELTTQSLSDGFLWWSVIPDSRQGQ